MSIENISNKKKEQIHNPNEDLAALEEASTSVYAEHLDRQEAVIKEQAEEQEHDDKVKASGVLEHLHDKAEHPGEGRESLNERTRERFQQQRGEVLEDKFAKGVVDNGLNLIPFVGGAKMMYESVRGKDVSGKEITGSKRIIHGALGAAAFALDTTGIGGALTEGVFLGKAGISAVEGLANQMKEKGDEKNGRIFERTAKFMEAHPEETASAQQEMNDRIRARNHSPERMAA